MPPAASSISNAASRLQRQVSRIDQKTAEKLFPAEQRLQWPEGYLPASGVAHLLHPDGIPFHEVLECYADIKQDRQHELQRDFASDYTLWNRCALEQFVRGLGASRRRRFTRLTARDRLVHDGDVRAVFQLPPYTPPPPPLPGDLLRGRMNPPQQQQQPLPQRAQTRPPNAVTASSAPAPPPHKEAPQENASTPQYYQFQPYAATQEYAMLPVRDIRSPQQRVRFSTFAQIRNVVHTDFDSMTALRGLSLYSDDAIVYTREMVQAVALYLQRRLDELAQAEPKFLAHAASPTGVTYAAETPVVAFFGNGRLAWMLNESGLLPKSVRAVQLPRQEAQRRRRQSHLLQQQPSLQENLNVHSAFSTIFPCETLSVGDALRKYRPAVALVEPHVDRDYLSDLRGYFSVREVLCLGPIDSPAMGSFAFPFLSFGVTPGPASYWAYNDNLHKVSASARIQMPMDPPHELQGYERHYVDDISAYLISPNDCPVLSNQFRCLAFRRVRPPVLKPATPATPAAQRQHPRACQTEEKHESISAAKDSTDKEAAPAKMAVPPATSEVSAPVHSRDP